MSTFGNVSIYGSGSRPAPRVVLVPCDGLALRPSRLRVLAEVAAAALKERVESIRAAGRPESAIAHDEAMIAAARNAFGPIDILVAKAKIRYMARSATRM